MSHDRSQEVDMTSSPRIPPTEMRGAYGSLAKWLSRRMIGKVPESLGVMWHNRTVLRDTSGVGRKCERWDACDKTLKSFAHMAVASLVGCSFCLDYGYFKAHDEKLDEAKASQVPRWRQSDVFTPLERDVMEYAEAMSRTPTTVTDELSARLLDALGPAALVELTACIGLANFAARSNTALGITSEGFSTVCELPLAEPSHVASVA
jgi:alkylhydroperoxidase family enzyme